MRKCILHIPWQLLNVSVSATEIRPYRMLEAFRNIGYEVYFVMGNAVTRKRQIRELRNHINNGEKFDFLYSESSTLPMMLTETHHLPTHPLVDISLLRLCKKNKIPIGLFYRDIYWAYPSVHRFNAIKHYYSRFFHQLDIRIYNMYVDTLYFPSQSAEICYNLIPSLSRKIAFHDLMPGTQSILDKSYKHENYFLFIGSISIGVCDIRMILSVFHKFPQHKLIICTSEEAWRDSLPFYQKLISDNISVVHEVNDAAQSLIRNSKYTLCYFAETDYRKIAIPYKFFDNLSYGKPTISNVNDNTGKLVKANGIGFAIEYSEIALTNLLNNLPDDNEYQRLVDKSFEYAAINTWSKRAEKVRDDLCSFGGKDIE